MRIQSRELIINGRGTQFIESSRVQACSALHSVNQWLRDEVWDQQETLSGASWLTEKMVLEPQNNHLVRAWLPGSFMDQRWGGEMRRQSNTLQSLQTSPRMPSLRQGNVLVSLPCGPSQASSSGYLLKAVHYSRLQKWKDEG